MNTRSYILPLVPTAKVVLFFRYAWWAGGRTLFVLFREWAVGVDKPKIAVNTPDDEVFLYQRFGKIVLSLLMGILGWVVGYLLDRRRI